MINEKKLTKKEIKEREKIMQALKEYCDEDQDDFEPFIGVRK